jgi:hypothetical protein
MGHEYSGENAHNLQKKKTLQTQFDCYTPSTARVTYQI